MLRTRKTFLAIATLSTLTLGSLAYVWAKALQVNGSRPAMGSNPEDEINRRFTEPKEDLGRRPLVVEAIEPLSVVKLGAGHYFVEFPKAVFGTIRLTFDHSAPDHDIEVRLGERRSESPGVWSPIEHASTDAGWTGYFQTTVRVSGGVRTITVQVPERFRPSPRDLPNGLRGVVPFRFAEIRGRSSVIEKSSIRQLAVHYPFNDAASRFSSSNPTLDRVWDLSKHTIKATSYAGVYVDGDRERKPYEADAYINQLGHYGVDAEYGLARYTLAYLLENPTWPTEWLMHPIFMAHADHLYTGDLAFLRRIYPKLKRHTLDVGARDDGLLDFATVPSRRALVASSLGLQAAELHDVIDWPAAERDHYNVVPAPGYWKNTVSSWLYGLRGRFADVVGLPYAAQRYRAYGAHLTRIRYEILPVNTVVNAFHYRALRNMAEIAHWLGEHADAKAFDAQADRVRDVMLAKLFNREAGVFTDGEGSDHSSLHANLFPLAFGVVPDAYKPRVLAFIKAKGMAGSVYSAQYLLEGLYENGESDYALSLLTSASDRGWVHMIDGVGSTMTLESWNPGVNPEMDRNHAWGAAPANIIPRWLLGIRPTSPGFKSFVIAPQPGSLGSAQIALPTTNGRIVVALTREADRRLDMRLEIPANTSAQILVPAPPALHPDVFLDGRRVAARRLGSAVDIGRVGGGKHFIRATFVRDESPASATPHP